MFKLHLYTVSSEVNRVDKSSELSEDFTLNGTLKDDCSIINPMIMVAADANIVGFNYAYVEEFKRYYFINDITALNNGMWELSMHVDVLMSFKDGLLKLPAFISRNEKEYNPLLVDDRFPIEGATRPNKIATLKTFKTTGNPDNQYNILIVLASNAYYVGPSGLDDGRLHDENLTGWGDEETSPFYGTENLLAPWGNGIICLIVTRKMAAKLLQQAASGYEGSEIFLDSILNIYDIALPFDITDNEGDRPLGIKEVKATVGTPTHVYVQAKADRYLLNKSWLSLCELTDTFYYTKGAVGVGGEWMFSFMVDTNNFLDYPPYRRIYLQLPFCSRTELDITYFSKNLKTQRVIIEYKYDFTTATVGYVISVNNIVTAVLEGSFGSPLPIQRSNAEQINAVAQANSTRFIGNIIGSILTLGLSTAIPSLSTEKGVAGFFGGLPSLIASHVAEQQRLVKSAPTENPMSKYLTFYLDEAAVYEVRCGTSIEFDDEKYLSLNGKPLRETRLLSETHGYTEIFNIHLEDFYATSEEKDEIESKLESGVILP